MPLRGKAVLQRVHMEKSNLDCILLHYNITPLFQKNHSSWCGEDCQSTYRFNYGDFENCILPLNPSKRTWEPGEVIYAFCKVCNAQLHTLCGGRDRDREMWNKDNDETVIKRARVMQCNLYLIVQSRLAPLAGDVLDRLPTSFPAASGLVKLTSEPPPSYHQWCRWYLNLLRKCRTEQTDNSVKSGYNWTLIMALGQPGQFCDGHCRLKIK